jgi:membrane-associated PAP2 superfamily phosphatase
MNNKFLELYFIAGTVSLLFLVVQVIDTYPNFNPITVFANWIICLLFYYLFFKKYNERKDGE